MSRYLLLVAIMSLALVTDTADADIITIDFEGFTANTGFTSGSEDGFHLLVTGGASIIGEQDLFPIAGKFLYSNDVLNVDNVISMTETDGSTFMFRTVDGRWAASNGSQTIRVEGFRLGASVGTDVFDVASFSGSETFSASILSGIIVDRLEFSLTARAAGGGAAREVTYMDNIVVSSIPEPNSAGLLLVLAGLAGTRRTRSRNN